VKDISYAEIKLISTVSIPVESPYQYGVSYFAPKQTSFKTALMMPLPSLTHGINQTLIYIFQTPFTQFAAKSKTLIKGNVDYDHKTI
jgi:hypothetical protein